jgi:AcrR family transcriptional regulator
MPIQARRERERAEREKLIVAAARELAETEGWEAVTTRRLAERVEYSQPVLYSHFKGMDAIMAAVAVEGFGDMAAELREARLAAGGGKRGAVAESREVRGVVGGGAKAEAARGAQGSESGAELAAVSTAYTAFAERRPALYDAMFSRTVDLPFATAEAPPALQSAFGELAEALRPHAGADDLGVLTETFWAALHGLATLMRGGRLPRRLHEERLRLLLARFTAQPAGR